MTTVFPNHMVAHVWAQQEQPEGHSHNGNFHFEGTRLYSYQTCIARFVVYKQGHPIVLATSERYSVTTSGKHMPAMRGALRSSVRVFYVPYVATSTPQAMEDNLAHLVKVYKDEVARLKRKRYYVSGYSVDYLDKYSGAASGYAEAFGLPAPELDSFADRRAIEYAHAARNAKRNNPKEIAKRERAAARKAKRDAEKDHIAILEALERLAIWRTGAAGFNAIREFKKLPCALRVFGETLETSWGAVVPLEHAKRAFRLVASMRAANVAWTRSPSISDMAGEQSLSRVGQFTVDRIEANGDIKAGCHTILWPEIERVARELGLIEGVVA